MLKQKLPKDGIAETCWSNKENYSAPVVFNTLDIRSVHGKLNILKIILSLFNAERLIKTSRS
jgi:hypothetical protein